MLGVGIGPAVAERCRSVSPLAGILARYPAAQAFHFDDGDWSGMFRDTAGTLPVTAAGQSVSLQLDRSGRGNHLVQATAAKRPTTAVDASGRRYLAWDGVDDAQATAAAIAWGSGEVSLCAGVYDSTAGLTFRTVVEFSVSSSSNDGAFGLFVPYSPAGTMGWRSRGSGAEGLAVSPVEAVPRRAIVSARGKIADDLATLRINGLQAAAVATDQGAGVYGSHQLFFGARNRTSLYFVGRTYQRFGIAVALSDAEIAALERHIGAYTGGV